MLLGLVKGYWKGEVLQMVTLHWFCCKRPHYLKPQWKCPPPQLQFSEAAHPNCMDCCGIKTIQQLRMGPSFVCCASTAITSLVRRNETGEVYSENAKEMGTGSGTLGTTGIWWSPKRRQLPRKVRRHRSGKNRGKVAWYSWGEKNKTKQQISGKNWNRVNGMEKWVKAPWSRSYKRQELIKGGKNKNKKRGVSLIVVEQSLTHHRTELTLSKSKHSLTAWAHLPFSKLVSFLSNFIRRVIKIYWKSHEI